MSADLSILHRPVSVFVTLFQLFTRTLQPELFYNVPQGHSRLEPDTPGKNLDMNESYLLFAISSLTVEGMLDSDPIYNKIVRLGYGTGT